MAIDKKEVEGIIQGFFKQEKIQKVERYRHLNKNIKKGQILFTGSSLMEQFPINEIAMTHGLDKVIYNRGIGGYTIPEMLEAMDEQIFDLEPSKIFINIGTNDMSFPEWTVEGFKENYRKILDQIKERLPEAVVYMMAYYPVNLKAAGKNDWGREAAERRLERLPQANKGVQELAAEYGYRYIDVNAGLTDESGQTKEEFSIDGIHMWSDAYEIVFENMKEYILE